MAQSLTIREQEILSFILNEQSSCEIAAKLELSVRTVETHRKNIYRKTQTGNLVGLIKYSIRMGFLDGFHFIPASPQVEAAPVVRMLQHTA
jgi:DNA-binding CsgD family transcriptional regulator